MHVNTQGVNVSASFSHMTAGRPKAAVKTRKHAVYDCCSWSSPWLASSHSLSGMNVLVIGQYRSGGSDGSDDPGGSSSGGGGGDAWLASSHSLSGMNVLVIGQYRSGGSDGSDDPGGSGSEPGIGLNLVGSLTVPSPINSDFRPIAKRLQCSPLGSLLILSRP